MPGKGERGFTLIETLVAFSVAALALTAILRIYGNASTAANTAAIRLAAVELADEQIERLLSLPAGTGTLSGTTEDHLLVWEAQVRPAKVPEALLDAGPSAALLQISVAVTRTGERVPLIEATTLRSVPLRGGSSSQ